MCTIKEWEANINDSQTRLPFVLMGVFLVPDALRAS